MLNKVRNLIILIIVTILFQKINACEVTLFHSYTKLRSEGHFSEGAIEKSNCSNLITNQVIELISEIANGNTEKKINASYLKSFFLGNVVISPNEISFLNIQNLIQNKVQPSFKIFDIRDSSNQTEWFSNKRQTLLTSGGILTPDVSGKKSISLTISNSLPKWISFTLKTKVTVIKTTRAIQDISLSLHSGIIEQTEIWTESPEKYFQEIKNINFYKPTKTLNANSLILLSDVTKAQIIKSGDLLEIIYRGKSLSLSQRGYATQGGTLGDVISIKTSKSKVSGRIISGSQAEVNL